MRQIIGSHSSAIRLCLLLSLLTFARATIANPLVVPTGKTPIDNFGSSVAKAGGTNDDGYVHTSAMLSTLPNGTMSSDGRWWDGFGWPGMNGDVSAVCEYDSMLIAAGSFTEAGGFPAEHIARWDGKAWTPLGVGVHGDVSALIAFEGSLIVAGAFEAAGTTSGKTIHNLARWDGTRWSDFTSGLNVGGWAGTDGKVYALAVYGGALVASGSFRYIDGVHTGGLARWNGTSWSPFPGGSGGTCLAVYEGSLIVTSTQVADIRRWDGVAWTNIGGGISGRVFAVTVHAGQMVAGG